MILYNLLIRIVFIGFLSISIYADKDIKEEEKDNDLEDFLEDLSHFPGLIDVYRNDDDGKVYFLIKKEQLEKEFIYFAHILDGIVEAGTWRGNYLDNGIIKFIKYYDQIRILSPDDFDKDMQEIYQEILSTRSNRGYGYWFWKPFFLKKIMNEINEGDIVHYLDIGCHIQNKNNRFYDYLDLIFDNEKWIVTFQYHDNNHQFAKDISFSKREEFKYTKADLFEYYNFVPLINF